MELFLQEIRNKLMLWLGKWHSLIMIDGGKGNYLNHKTELVHVEKMDIKWFLSKQNNGLQILNMEYCKIERRSLIIISSNKI